MALQGPIPIAFDQVFPSGCYAVGEVEPVRDFDASTSGREVQARDKHSGEPVWQIAVMDADPTVKASQKTVAVKVISSVQPIPPAPMAGLPFTPVEFGGMSVTPYVNQQGRLAYSIRAREMRSPRTASKHTVNKEVAV
ncbi:plasmid replication, integration and excision activator [Nonomuraea aurantiaca]|uniref:plasmid replication, integration and excision activator n=1 Tax=Nonomuraea aurantiaca TaxID=2878562 RepID=UPI001CDA200C|nr:plasmid replication, integration and excision activator [Nonomuraea aurantiaca]MCA2229017.1 plasmid replication, integration and excision activator [Nonomuraea aurantiaca]